MANNSAVKMLLSILAILSVLHQAYPLETTEQNNLTCPLICNVDSLQRINDDLVKENENLRLQLAAINANRDEEDLPSSCTDAFKRSELYKIRIPNEEIEPFFVTCIEDPNKEDGAWTIIQRRMDGSVDFYRNWTDYQEGFGNLDGEFFLGLDKIHALTESAPHKLWVKMEDFENNTRSAYYSSFAIGNASEAYVLKDLGEFSGDAQNRMLRQIGSKFSTKDKDNDIYELNCAKIYEGAWWYNNCHDSSLNGPYLRGEDVMNNENKGVLWREGDGLDYSLKFAQMAIRPVSTSK